MKLYASGEDYLEAILVLQQKQGMVRSVDVARHMDDIVNIGLHFFLKNVRPYAASCSEA